MCRSTIDETPVSFLVPGAGPIGQSTRTSWEMRSGHPPSEKKYWLFIGDAEVGRLSASLYTIANAVGD